MADSAADRRTRLTVLVALAANLVIAAAKTAGGLVSGSPALLSEAAHSVADGLNEVGFLMRQGEIDNVAELLTMRLGMDSVLVAARIDLAPGIDSERVEEVSMRIREAMADRWPQTDQVFLDITNAPPRGGA